MITRSQSNPESDSDKNPVINNGDKDDVKTPMNVREPSPPTCNTPTSSLSDIAVRIQQPSPPTCNTPTSSLSDIAVRTRKLLESSVREYIFVVYAESPSPPTATMAMIFMKHYQANLKKPLRCLQTAWLKSNHSVHISQRTAS